MKRNSYKKRVGVCEVCGGAVYGTRAHKKTCSVKCRKALSRMGDNAHTKSERGGIRINGEWHPADTLRMWFDDVLSNYSEGKQ